MRITKSHVENKVSIINGMAGFDNSEWNTVGSIHLQGQYGGYAINKICNERGGITVLHGTSTLRECSAFLSGMIAVYRAAEKLV